MKGERKMTERTLERNEQAYKNMTAVAKMLEAMSKSGSVYRVEDVYLDYGQNWVWTTICRRGYSECQVLSPRDWKNIVLANSVKDLADVVEKIRNDKYFND